MGSELNKSPSLGVTIGWIELKVECSFNEFYFLVIRMLALHFIQYSGSIELLRLIYKAATRLVTRNGYSLFNLFRIGSVWLSL